MAWFTGGDLVVGYDAPGPLMKTKGACAGVTGPKCDDEKLESIELETITSWVGEVFIPMCIGITG
jgi:hypothetical protein